MSSKKQPWFPAPPLPCTGVESHAHLDGKQFEADFEETVARAKAAGCKNICQVFLDPALYRAKREQFIRHPEFFFIMGLHPTDLNEYSPEDVDTIKNFIDNDPLIRAIGEIGLDYYWKDVAPERQKEFFILQIRLAKSLNKPIVIHCREAEDDTLEILFAEGFQGHPLLWHCFGGDTALAKIILDAGWHISIPGPVTYAKNEALREAVAHIPADRLLVETDSPYLAPAPNRGKRNEPANLGYTIQAMAEARKVPVEELWTTCGDNARRFFGLT